MTPTAAFIAGAIAGAAIAGAAARAVYRRKMELWGRMFSFSMHEINTPITAVNMTVMNLLIEVFGALPPELKPWIEGAREQMGRLTGLVGEIRDFVHIELHKDLRVTSVEMPVDTILNEVLVPLRRGMEQAGLDFQIVTDKNLPSLLSDPDRASRCLSSVLFHARKFHRGGPITLKVFSRPSLVVFVVDYKGSPMSPDEVEASLALYYPARARKNQVLGATGLGLGLIRRVARIIGGDFDFTAANDGRATMTLSFKSVEGKV